jgi:hypothetical protein
MIVKVMLNEAMGEIAKLPSLASISVLELKINI